MSEAPQMDVNEFAKEIAAHQAGLRAYVRALGVSPGWVDDIAQESFLVAWNHLSSYDPERDFEAWVRGIARNIVMNERSKQGRRSRILSTKLTEILDANYAKRGEPRPERTEQLIAAMRECMTRIPSKSMALLKDRYEQNVGADDLAKRLGMTADAVRQALVRLRRKLRACIQSKVGEAVL